MIRRVIVRPLALDDIAQAVAWYEKQFERGNRFIFLKDW